MKSIYIKNKIINKKVLSLSIEIINIFLLRISNQIERGILITDNTIDTGNEFVCMTYNIFHCKSYHFDKTSLLRLSIRINIKLRLVYSLL